MSVWTRWTNRRTQSITHVDFMIGHEHMNIKGYTRDGQAVDIMIDGRLQV